LYRTRGDLQELTKINRRYEDAPDALDVPMP
jgi:hypothetical protein